MRIAKSTDDMPPKKRKPYNKSTGRKYTGNSYDAKYARKTVKKRAKRVMARRKKLAELTKKHGAAKAKKMMAGKDVGHKKPLSSGGTNASGNLKLQSKKKNRGSNRPKGKHNYPKTRKKPTK